MLSAVFPPGHITSGLEHGSPSVTSLDGQASAWAQLQILIPGVSALTARSALHRHTPSSHEYAHRTHSALLFARHSALSMGVPDGGFAAHAQMGAPESPDVLTQLHCPPDALSEDTHESAARLSSNPPQMLTRRHGPRTVPNALPHLSRFLPFILLSRSSPMATLA